MILVSLPGASLHQFYFRHPNCNNYHTPPMSTPLSLTLTKPPPPPPPLHRHHLHPFAEKKQTPLSLSSYVHLLTTSGYPDNFTFPALFQSCRSPCLSPQLHCHSIKFGYQADTYVQNTLIKMYSETGLLSSASKVFDKMLHRTVVSWATMIATYTKWGDPGRGLELYRVMMREGGVEPNEVVLVNVVAACAKARDLETVRGVHGLVKEKGFGFNLVLWTALLDAYCKCGRVFIARELFDGMLVRNLFCWNIMIKGYVECGYYAEALRLFRKMRAGGIAGDQITMASLVLGCAHLRALELGKWMHMYILKENVEVDAVLATALVDMFAKCGCVDNAIKVFEVTPRKDVAMWTALIGGLASSGHGERALQLFDEMERSRIKPNAVTFIGVLTACSDLGLVEKGHFYFNSMSRVYSIEPTVEHYGWMVNLLGRAGFVLDAERLIESMPMTPDFFVLSSILSACRVQRNLEVAERTARRLRQLNSRNGAVYMMLSHVYASLKNHDESEKVTELMKQKNIKKPTGSCLIELGGDVHEFVTGNESYQKLPDINVMVKEMIGHSKVDPQEPFNMDEEEGDENGSCWHSEKLAVAFGLISTSPGTPIRVRKNIRVCSDCHQAMKVVSEFYGREIVVRDRFQFHRFMDGSCSCKGFW